MVVSFQQNLPSSEAHWGCLAFHLTGVCRNLLVGELKAAAGRHTHPVLLPVPEEAGGNHRDGRRNRNATQCLEYSCEE